MPRIANRERLLRAGSLISMGAMLALGGGSALAQEVPPADDATIATPADIVVTARKRVETAQDVPISMVVLSGDALSDRGVRQIQDLMQYAPDLQQSNGAIGAFRTMRGGGSVGSNFSFEQSVGLFFDEISFGRNPQGRIPIFDVERAEVLRGPQVVSFGNSTTAGAISLTTRKPDDKFGLDLNSSYEFNQHQLVVNGGVTLPIAPGLSVRVSGITDQLSKGWVTAINGTTRSNEPRNNINAGRIIVKAEPIDGLTATLKYEHDDVRYNGSNLVTTTNRNNYPFIPSIAFVPTTFRGPVAPFNVKPSLRLKNDTVQAVLKYDIGGVSVTSNTAYWHYRFLQFEDADTTPAPIAISSPRDNFKQFSQELRVSGHINSSIDAMAGIFYQHDDQFGEFLLSGNRSALGIVNPPPAFSRVSGVDQKARTWSAFVDLTFKLAEGLELNPGVRYTDISRRGRQFAYGSDILSDVPSDAYNAFLGPVFGAVPHNFLLSTPEKHTMPQVVLTYKPNRDLNLFAKFVKGAKTGGLDFNYVAGDPNQASFKAEKVTDYEVGVKASLFDRTLNVSLTAFSSKYNDLQLSIFSVNRFVLSNAGGQLSKGLELDYSWRTPVEGLTVSGSGSYLDAKYTDFKGASCTLEQSFTLPAPCTQDLSGHPSGFSSKWYGAMEIAYSREIGRYKLDMSVDGNYRSSYRPSTNDDPVSRQDPNTILNARVQVGPTHGHWHVAAFGRNLTNEYYSNFYSPNGAVLTPGASLASLERTRQLGLEFGLRF